MLSENEMNEVIKLLRKLTPLLDLEKIENLMINEEGMIQVRIPEETFFNLYKSYFIVSGRYGVFDDYYIIRDGIRIHTMVKKGKDTWE